jgi:biopolymer transport protein ExbD
MAADVGGDSGGGKKGSKKGRKKKGNPRIDMTPMVDLGFLLLTFFVLTTTMSTPTAMPVVVPSDKDKNEPPDEIDKVSDQKILFLILSGKGRVYWYRGIKDIELQMTNYSAAGVRKIVMQQREEVKRSGLFTKDPDPMIALIKLTDDASYKNMVDILDEMNITEQKKYMIIDAEKGDVELIQAYEADQQLEPSLDKSLKMLDGGETAPTGA